MDLHISVIKDITNILETLYGKDQVEIVNWSLSGHNWVFSQPTTDVKIINQHTWRDITKEDIKLFQKEYDSYLSTFDGFIVTHTPVFCLLYEKYNKPIIMINSCRYEQPFCWRQIANKFPLWIWLNVSLYNMWKSGQLIAVSNNRADQEYLRIGTGIESIHIPSLCLYTGTKYNPVVSMPICVYGDRHIFPPLKQLVGKPQGRYKWSDLYTCRAIVHTPYEISTMSIFEQYSAGVPLFFPTKRFYKECILKGVMKLSSCYSQQYPTNFLPVQNIDFWLDRADFYDTDNFKYLYYYDSTEELIRLVNSFNEDETIKKERNAWIETRNKKILDQWKEILDKVIK
jgi:hypothetical protein